MPRPWAKRADELDGDDYAAWLEWFADREQECLSGTAWPFLEGLGVFQENTLYLICCELADGATTEATP